MSNRKGGRKEQEREKGAPAPPAAECRSPDIKLEEEIRARAQSSDDDDEESAASNSIKAARCSTKEGRKEERRDGRQTGRRADGRTDRRMKKRNRCGAQNFAAAALSLPPEFSLDRPGGVG